MAQQTQQASETSRSRNPAAGQQAFQGQASSGSYRHGSSIPLIAMRGIGRIYYLQASAARLFLQTQASAASAFGWPDYSGLFRFADERAQRAFSSGTEKFLSLAEQAAQTTSEVQRQVGRMLESQTLIEAENWQRGMEELGAQAEESFEELKSLACQQAEESIRVAEQIGDESRAMLQSGSEAMTQSVRQAASQSAAGDANGPGGDSSQRTQQRADVAEGMADESESEGESASPPAHVRSSQESAAAKRRSQH